MPTSLATLRQTPQLTPMQFLAFQPGCWLQFFDDTEAREPGKALSTPRFDLAIARRKQQDRCAFCFSLQAFGNSRTIEDLLCFRNLGADIDLIPRSERASLSTADIDRRKEEYLSSVLLPFPLQPHWLIETKHGFHAIFRILPLREDAAILEAILVNRRLVRVLKGDENAVLLTQLLRVPSTFQFKDPEHPFLCRLLLNNAAAIAPYDLATVRSTLDTWERKHGMPRGDESKDRTPVASGGEQPSRWRVGLAGVPSGQRNATATSLIGKILYRLPEDLWETAGWGGLKEWNQRNDLPLPERELRSVFKSIARRERDKRQRQGREAEGERAGGTSIRVDVRVDGARIDLSPSVEASASDPDTTPPSASATHHDEH